MTPENFAYWLQGFVELHGAPPSAEQWEQIKDHLGLVFDKKTSTRLWEISQEGQQNYQLLKSIQC